MAVPGPGIALPSRRPLEPARRRHRRETTRRPAQAPGIALRAIDAFQGISSSPLLDRLVRGRIWIGLLAFALIGIVAMQLLVLQLNTRVGHTLLREAALERQNAQLGVENSMSSGENLVAPAAAAAGMTLAPVGTVHFVIASPANVARAAAVLSTATQVSTGATAGSNVAESSTATTTTEPQTTPAGGEPAGSGEGPQASSATAEKATGASETSSAGATQQGAAVATQQGAAATSSSPATTSTASSSTTEAASSGTGPQANGASAAPSNGTAAGAESSGPGGGTRAGSGE